VILLLVSNFLADPCGSLV